MQTETKVIQTFYAGRFFRSRTEARVAVFYDALSVPYEYEKEGFALPSGWYLPDFFLPEQDCWVETKGLKPTKTEIRLCEELAAHTEKRVHLFWKPMEMESELRLEPKMTAYAMFPAFGENDEVMGVDTDDGYCWCECEQCGCLGITYHGKTDRLPCKSNGCTLSGRKDECPNFASPKLQGAYRAALSARFEHGQSGAA